MNSLDLINPSELQDYWELIKPGLEKVKEHSVDGWILEDVYHAIKSGSSGLHIAYIDQEYAGFCVLTPIQGYSCKKLHIWCGYSTGVHDIIKTFWPEIEKIGRYIGARKISFSSPRSWERRMKSYGLKEISRNYEVDL